MYDVVVVGGGPAGAATARRCAQMGLNSLILEKERLPRDKVCSGWVMGVGRPLLEKEYGPVPPEVLCRPSSLRGFAFHVPGIDTETIDSPSLVSWRRDLDRWLVVKAQEEGVEVWEGARLGEVVEGTPYVLKVVRQEVPQDVQARFVVGADGANSTLRKALFPDLEVPYSQAYQEWFPLRLPMEEGYGHLFFSPEIAPFYGAAHHKGEFLVLEVGSRMGQVKEAIQWLKGALAREYGFPLEAEAAGKGACVEPVLYTQLFTGSLRPARGNALLVGDAAGLLMPVTGEGIGMAMVSALVAARSISQALRKDLKAEESYLKGIQGLLSILQKPYNMARDTRPQAEREGRAFLESVVGSWAKTLEMSEAVAEAAFE